MAESIPKRTMAFACDDFDRAAGQYSRTLVFFLLERLWKGGKLMVELLSWKDQLSAEQANAASHVGSHARLLAGPGTGKTYTLAGRVAFLVTEQGIAPSDILILTFTRMATRELRFRIRQRLAP